MFRTLAMQSRRPDRVILYIPRQYRRWPDFDGPPPALPDGVELRIVDEDFGPATKILPAVREFAGQPVDLLLCDDDGLYPRNWAARFESQGRKRPGMAIAGDGFEVGGLLPDARKGLLTPRAMRTWRKADLAYQARLMHWAMLQRLTGKPGLKPRRHAHIRSGYVDIFEGYAGVLVRPEFFDEEAFVIPDVCRHVDDVWLSGMLARRGIPIWLDAGQQTVQTTEAELAEPLVNMVVGGFGRLDINRQAAEHLRKTFAIWT
ncbi:glycosyltransferase family 2 protein [Oceanicola sp. 22II-s10i]|uniref:glycosyltransferase family 2 protein n=1 Tax=Oceanicola sp. 22II-s10i TaxID=1317116 RepID=UPI00112FF004|nr:glycosyltransferase family 2 protein [Oceanicola sp. 22II-s10i]